MPISLHAMGRHCIGGLLAATLLALGACGRSPEPEPAAPPPAPTTAPEPGAAEEPRAPVAGRFRPADDVAAGATGALDVTESRIVGANGASFETVVAGRFPGDQLFGAAPAEPRTFATVLGVGAQDGIELRRVTVETPPDDAVQGFCAPDAVGYFALSLVPGADGEQLRVAALRKVTSSGEVLANLELCASVTYLREG